MRRRAIMPILLAAIMASSNPAGNVSAEEIYNDIEVPIETQTDTDTASELFSDETGSDLPDTSEEPDSITVIPEDETESDETADRTYTDGIIIEDTDENASIPDMEPVSEEQPLIEEAEEEEPASEEETDAIEEGIPDTELSQRAGVSDDGGFSGRPGKRMARRLYASGKAFSGSYGNQLTGDEKTAYDALTANWGGLKGTSSFDIVWKDPIVITVNASVDDAYKTGLKYQQDSAYKNTVQPEVRRRIYAAMDAFFYDNPDIFWCDQASFGFAGEHPSDDGSVIYQSNGDGTSTLTFRSIHIGGGHETWGGASGQIGTFRNALASAVSDLSSRISSGDSDAVKARKIADYIDERTDYVSTDAAHTAYGPLVQGNGVCDGYTKAFNLLCSKFGVKCVMGSGLVDAGGDSEAHAWSYVSINGKWYLADTTFNDSSEKPEAYTLIGSGTVPAGETCPISDQRTNYTEFSTSLYSRSFVQPVLSQDAYHEWKDAVVANPTCVEDGKSVSTCLIHDEQTEKVIRKTGIHTYGDWTVTKRPDCIHSGTKTRKCSVCGSTETADVPAAGKHTAGEWRTQTSATCGKEGIMTQTCKVCGTVINTKAIPATGKHSYGEWKTDKEPDCIHAGSKTRTCTICGQTETAETPATGKHAAGGWTREKDPTCGSAGKEVRKCTVCGEITEARDIAATGRHSFSAWTAAKAAGCEAQGTETRKCSVCGTVEMRTVKAAGHTFGVWKQTKAPTALAAGVRTRRCSRCGKTETQQTAKLKAKGSLNVSGTLPMKKGQRTTRVVISGLAYGDKVVSWRSSNSKIVSVAKRGGLGSNIKAKKKGTAKITVTLASGLTRSFTVRVQTSTVKTSRLNVAGSRKIYLKKGQTYRISASAYPITSQTKISYRSSSSRTASVSKRGVIKAKKKGTATVTIFSGKKKVKIKIIVRK